MTQTSKEKVGPGKFVAFAYKLYNDADGCLLFETPVDAPDALIYGVTADVTPGLLVALKGLSAGDKFSVTLPPEAAFGERIPENEMELDKEIFSRDGKLAEEVKVGAELPMLTQEGFRVLGRVLEIGDKVRMDFNHPFAGMTVKYDGEVLEVRDATPEELQQAQGCGCCGHDHGGCSDGGCSDGCCGGHDHDGCGCH